MIKQRLFLNTFTFLRHSQKYKIKCYKITATSHLDRIPLWFPGLLLLIALLIVITSIVIMLGNVSWVSYSAKGSD